MRAGTTTAKRWGLGRRVIGARGEKGHDLTLQTRGLSLQQFDLRLERKVLGTGRVKPRSASWSIAAVAVAGLAMVPFVRSLGGELLGWDDRRALLDFTGWRGLSPAQLAWDFTSTTMGMYRPLTWLSYGVDFVVSELDPAGFHRTNLLLHGALAVALLFVLRRFVALAFDASPPPWLLGVVVLAFAVHPLRVQVVAWVSARADLLATLFFVLATGAWLRHLEARGTGWRLAWHALFAASLLSKPVALAAPVAWWLAQRWLSTRRPALARPGVVDLLLGLAASAAVTVPLLWAKGVVHAGGGLPELPPSAAFTALHNAVQPLGKTLVPVGLGLAEPAWPFEPFELPYVLGALVALALAAAVWTLRRRAPGLALTAVAWVGLLGPMLGLLPFGYELTADRFSFLPSVALLPGLAWLLGRAPPRAVAVAAAVLLPAAGAWSHVRCGDWLSSEAFWQRNLALNPRSALAHSGLGDAALTRQQLREAEAHYLRAIELLPPYEPTLLGLGFIDLQEGRLEAGVAKLERYRVTHPESRGARRFLRQAYEQLGRPEDAAALDEPR